MLEIILSLSILVCHLWAFGHLVFLRWPGHAFIIVILTTPKVFAVSIVVLFRIFSLFLASFTSNGITLGFIFKLTVKFYKIQIHHFSLIWLLPWNCFSIKSVESKLKICTSITCSTADLKSSVMVGRGKNKFCLCLRNYGPNYISTWTNWS